ncbi:MAG: glycosyltransferase [Phycisphaerales bacterium]|jgi:glycosyltransferase involved in cell wall biosynthesis
MHILHVINTLDPKTGGPPAVATRLAAAQASLGHEVGIVCYADPAADARIASSLAPIPGMSAVTIHTIAPEVGGRGRLVAPNAHAWFDANFPKQSFIHIHGVWDRLLLRAARAAARLRVPYVIVPHGMLDPWSISGQGIAKTIKKRVGLLVAYRSMLAKAAFVHVLNPYEAAAIKAFNLPAPTEIIPNGIFEAEVSPLPAPGAFRAKHPELGADPYVLFLSRVHFKKGLDFLVEAFATLSAAHPALRLVIAGPDDGYLATLKELIQRAGVADHVHVVGPLYGTDKLAAFIDATAFCLPSRQEGFSVAILEAMACGIPVVITEECRFPQVGPAGAGFVVPLGAAHTAAALGRVLKLPDPKAMGAKGRDLVLSQFTWPRIAEQTIEAYGRRSAVAKAR